MGPDDSLLPNATADLDLELEFEEASAGRGPRIITSFRIVIAISLEDFLQNHGHKRAPNLSEVHVSHAESLDETGKKCQTFYQNGKNEMGLRETCFYSCYTMDRNVVRL